MKKSTIILVLGICLFVGQAFGQGGAANIISTAQSAGSFNTLITAVNTAGLTSTLESPGPFTVFAPTDAAFNRLPPGTVEFLLRPENRPLLTQILTYHVVAGSLTSKDVLSNRAFSTVEGSKIRARATFGKAVVNSSPISGVNVLASNGIIHVIDTVLMPAEAMSVIENALGQRIENIDKTEIEQFEFENKYPLFRESTDTVTATVFDFYGEGRTSFSVARSVGFDPNNPGIVWQRANFANTQDRSKVYGVSAIDSLTPNDFTGDGIYDLNVWRIGSQTTSPASYFVDLGSSFLNLPWGTSFDIPGLEADYDGDGKADPTIVRDINGTFNWFILGSRDGYLGSVSFGNSSTDVPLPGADYNGDGKDDICVLRVSPDGSVTYFIGGSKFAGTSAGTILTTQNWGNFKTDYFVTGDFIGDSKADFAVWRGFGSNANGFWYIRENGGVSGKIIKFGSNNSDLPLRADFDGDRKQDLAVYRGSSRTFFWLRSSDNGFEARVYGQNGDFPVANLGIK